MRFFYFFTWFRWEGKVESPHNKAEDTNHPARILRHHRGDRKRSRGAGGHLGISASTPSRSRSLNLLRELEERLGGPLGKSLALRKQEDVYSLGLSKEYVCVCVCGSGPPSGRRLKDAGRGNVSRIGIVQYHRQAGSWSFPRRPGIFIAVLCEVGEAHGGQCVVVRS